MQGVDGAGGLGFLPCEPERGGVFAGVEMKCSSSGLRVGDLAFLITGVLGGDVMVSRKVKEFPGLITKFGPFSNGFSFERKRLGLWGVFGSSVRKALESKNAEPLGISETKSVSNYRWHV